MHIFFQKKVIVITGASSGIGRAIAEAAFNYGANLALCARNLNQLQRVFPQESERLFLFKADVSIEQECATFVAATLAQWGRIDILVNNAGLSMRALFEELDTKIIKNLMDVNFWGCVWMTKAVLPSIVENKGIVVGMSSVAGYRGLPARTGYSASKFAMQGFLEALRTEMLYKGVHVMWVSPGFTASNIRKTALAADGNTQNETPLDEKKLMTAEKCAEITLQAIKKKKRTIVMTREGILTVWLNKLFPKLMDRIIFKHFSKESNSPLIKQ